eukprot:324512-Pyramimonas_sp.AAC.1
MVYLSCITTVSNRFYTCSNRFYTCSKPQLSWVAVEEGSRHLFPSSLHYLDVDDNGDLYAYVMPLEVKLGLALQLVDALAELKERGVVHCDVKPANILLSKVRCFTRVAANSPSGGR